MLNINTLSVGLLGKQRFYFEAPEAGFPHPIREKPPPRALSTLVFCSRPVGSGAVTS